MEQKQHRWTAKEDELLRAAVHIHGDRAWSAVMQDLPGRTSKACSQRWRHHLNPTVNHPSKSPFTEWEVAVVVQAQKLHGNHWQAIAALLPPGRTNHAVKNLFVGNLKQGERLAEIHNRYLEANTPLQQLLQMTPGAPGSPAPGSPVPVPGTPARTAHAAAASPGGSPGVASTVASHALTASPASAGLKLKLSRKRRSSGTPAPATPESRRLHFGAARSASPGSPAPNSPIPAHATAAATTYAASPFAPYTPALLGVQHRVTVLPGPAFACINGFTLAAPLHTTGGVSFMASNATQAAAAPAAAAAAWPASYTPQACNDGAQQAQPMDCDATLAGASSMDLDGVCHNFAQDGLPGCAMELDMLGVSAAPQGSTPASAPAQQAAVAPVAVAAPVVVAAPGPVPAPAQQATLVHMAAAPASLPAPQRVAAGKRSPQEAGLSAPDDDGEQPRPAKRARCLYEPSTPLAHATDMPARGSTPLPCPPLAGSTQPGSFGGASGRIMSWPAAVVTTWGPATAVPAPAPCRRVPDAAVDQVLAALLQAYDAELDELLAAPAASQESVGDDESELSDSEFYLMAAELGLL